MELNKLYQDYQDMMDHHAQKRVPPEMIEEIIKQHHEFINELLAELAFFVKKISLVHGGHQPHLVELYALYTQLYEELTTIIDIKEKVISPSLLSPEKDMLDIQMPLKALAGQYDQVEQIWSEIRIITNDFNPPKDACNTYRLSFMKLAELESFILESITLEKKILPASLSC